MDEYNVVQSFSKKSYPWDNAVIESFFNYLKHEETNRRSFLETEDCQKCLFTLSMVSITPLDLIRITIGYLLMKKNLNLIN